MDRLTAAKVFIDVAYSRSFTATAERLEMSRPMVTRYIEAMENWLHARLLHRTTRKISLTTAGESCLKDVEAWLAQADNLTALVAPGEELSGSVRIVTSMSFGFSQLIPAVTAFMKLHSKVNIDIDVQDSVTDFVEQRVDLAIRIASEPDPALIGKPIAICDSVLVASPEYLQDKPGIEKPEDLSVHDCLGYKNFERNVWHLSQQEQFESVNIHCRLSANEASTLLHAAILHAGISMQPCYLANRYIKEGVLSAVLPDWKVNDLKIYALYPSRKHLSPTVRALIDYLDAYFRQYPW
ncbi:MAG: DNA-binding transcriptional LysR family regulator [Psychromonas sp.]|jgi:DNA-binding transcriptional LysR family regulator|uniref:LysR family transcriptional regulator n=1 Tax=Psychromonas sp. TaxID=1884585 RepID=UPI0039E5372B